MDYRLYVDTTQFDKTDYLQIREFYLRCDIVYCILHEEVFNAFSNCLQCYAFNSIGANGRENRIPCTEYGQHNKHSRKLKCINHEKYAGI